MAAKKRAARRGPKAEQDRDLESTPAEQRRIVVHLRAFAHPLRLKLFELFSERPRTTMQVAELIGQPPTRLYHHVNALERAGLLRLRETKPIRGTVEKYYEAVVDAAPKAHSAGVLRKNSSARHSARAAARAVLEQARQDLFAAMGDLPEMNVAPMVVRMLLGATPTQAGALGKRLLALVKEIKEECGEEKMSDDAERWSLTFVLTPSWPRRSSKASVADKER